MEPRFGDLVRVLFTPQTERAGLAGRVGRVRGETRPSVSGVAVIGDVADDFALHVHFDERKESHWITLDLVEFLDAAAGSTERLRRTEKQGARPKTEEWQEKDLPSSRWRRFLRHLRGRG